MVKRKKPSDNVSLLSIAVLFLKHSPTTREETRAESWDVMTKHLHDSAGNHPSALGAAHARTILRVSVFLSLVNVYKNADSPVVAFNVNFHR